MSLMQGVNAKVRKNPKELYLLKVKTKICSKQPLNLGKNKLGTPILIGTEKKDKRAIKKNRIR